eukprot:TRINITY_DN33967_c0_g1_i2.p2 TRINITY_DN33967_c0_g1~~TRINITY_DN33967_c0_g1_i2.p2  ORF type:complete len:247 (+),score=78.51 TRINITY_DN33967_c0_g1_i2:486-1226(+)
MSKQNWRNVREAEAGVAKAKRGRNATDLGTLEEATMTAASVSVDKTPKDHASSLRKPRGGKGIKQEGKFDEKRMKMMMMKMVLQLSQQMGMINANTLETFVILTDSTLAKSIKEEAKDVLKAAIDEGREVGPVHTHLVVVMLNTLADTDEGVLGKDLKQKVALMAEIFTDMGQETVDDHLRSLRTFKCFDKKLCRLSMCFGPAATMPHRQTIRQCIAKLGGRRFMGQKNAGYMEQELQQMIEFLSE